MGNPTNSASRPAFELDAWSEFLTPPQGIELLGEESFEGEFGLSATDEEGTESEEAKELGTESLLEWTQEAIEVVKFLMMSEEEGAQEEFSAPQDEVGLLFFEEVDENEQYLDEIDQNLEALPDAGPLESSPPKGKKRALRKAKLRVVTEDDFDHEKEKKIVRLLKARVDEILDKRVSAERRQVWLDWFFVPLPDEFGLKFTDLSLAMGCFPWLVRERLVFYLARKRIRMNRPFDILACTPDEDYASLAYIEGGGDLARRVLSRIWSQPGVSKQEVLGDLGQSDASVRTRIDHVIERLMETRLVLGIIDQEQGFDYRNPMLYAASRKNIIEYEQSNKTS